MGNSVDSLMDAWRSEKDPEKLFSDQIQDDNAFFFEEPDIGLDQLQTESPQSGEPAEPIQTRKVNEELISEGKPSIFKTETAELERMAKEQRGIEIGNELDRMLGYIASYGVVHGLGLFYDENDQFIEDNYVEEESLG